MRFSSSFGSGMAIMCFDKVALRYQFHWKFPSTEATLGPLKSNAYHVVIPSRARICRF
jgi:hypothetical protein